MANGCPSSCIVTILSIKIVILAIIVYFTIPGVPEPPIFEENNWFGKGDRQPENTSIQPFAVSISQEIIDDLKHRLVNTRFVDGLEGIQWEYGTNKDYLVKFTDYWAKHYDWRTHENLLNTFPHYHTTIDGLKVHFLHIKPQVKPGQTVVPIMFIHGWPGSFYEFYKVLPLLNKESQTGKFSFEIICPSLPGYGFSEAAHKPGLTAISTAAMFSKLMARLGHESYYIQGGDFGSVVARAMALVNKRHIKGIHLNLFTSIPPYGIWSYLIGYFTLPTHEHKKIFPLKDFFYGVLRETGYLHIQATRPDSIGVGLTNSPAGLAAYIVEKFFGSSCNLNESSDCLEACFTKDELITNLMIYWVTNSMTSAMRFYKENFASNQPWDMQSIPIDVPSGLAEFPELFISPKPWVLSTFTNNIQYSLMEKGGHFAALGQPKLFANDVVQFVKKVEGIAKKKD